MKKTIFLVILLYCSSLIQAQVNESEMFIQEEADDIVKIDVPKEKDKKIRTEILLGSSFAMAGNNQFAINTYVQPTIAYKMTPRFEISMGLMAVKSNINNYTYYNYEGQAQSIDYNGLSAYYTLQGAYLLTENLKVYGGIMIGTEAMNWNANATSKNKMNPKAYQIGLQYKLGEHAYIQLEFQYREGDPWGSSTMNRSNALFMQPMSTFGSPDPFSR
jgi:hypothetical protein